MTRSRSKTIATWLALVVGALGLHRLYLRGDMDRWAWFHLVPTLVGGYGAWRMREIGVDDRIGGLLVLVLGAMLTYTMLLAMVYGLMPDERWNARFNRAAAPSRSGGLVVLGVIAALAIGATVLISAIAFSAQLYFERNA